MDDFPIKLMIIMIVNVLLLHIINSCQFIRTYNQIFDMEYRLIAIRLNDTFVQMTHFSQIIKKVQIYLRSPIFKNNLSKILYKNKY